MRVCVGERARVCVCVCVCEKERASGREGQWSYLLNMSVYSRVVISRKLAQLHVFLCAVQEIETLLQRHTDAHAQTDGDRDGDGGRDRDRDKDRARDRDGDGDKDRQRDRATLQRQWQR